MVWIPVAAAGDVPPGQGRRVSAGRFVLALFNDGGSYRATDDACPHQGASLSGGTLVDGRVICPLHSWVFDLATGRCPRGTHEPVAVYATRRAGEAIEIEIPEDPAPAEDR
jgi:nitrite reductase/ring-hydroxylating ferredoxin subunit